jgi:hypothetical protein
MPIPTNENNVGLNHPMVVNGSAKVLEHLIAEMMIGQIDSMRAIGLILTRLLMTAPPEITDVVNDELEKLAESSQIL